MVVNRMVALFIGTCLVATTSWAGTVYDAYPGDNLNAMDEVLTYGDTLIIHEGDYPVDPDDRTGGRIWRSDLRGDDPGTPEVEWITIRGAEGENRPRLYYYGNLSNMIDLNGTTDHVRIQYLEIQGGSVAVKINAVADHVVLEDLHIHDNPDGGINLPNVTAVTNLVIRLNYLHHIGSECMYIGKHGVGGVSDSLIEHNVLHHISGAGAHGDGIELKYGDYNCIVQDNVIARTTLPGICTYATGRNNPAENNIVRRNVIYAAWDAGIQTTAETTIENNLIIDCPNRGIAVQPHTGPDMRYLRVVNNTIFATGERGLSLADITGSPVVIANNAIYQRLPDEGNAIEVITGMVPTTVILNNYYYGQTVGIEGITGFIEGNPPEDEFISPSIDDTYMIHFWPDTDLYPKVGSSLIDAGDNGEAPPDDFNKLTARPYNGTVEVGAYEWTEASNPGWKIADEEFKQILAGDLDDDLDVDLDDYALFARALNGPLKDAGHPLADMDLDGDTDVQDAAKFAEALGGP